jgi:hypothetical protein
MRLPTRHPRERLGIKTTNPNRRHPPPRRCLAQPERLDAVRKQRREPKLEKKLPLIKLREMSQQLCRDLIAAPHDARKRRQQLLIRQRLQTILLPHPSRVTRVFQSSPLLHGSCFQPQTGFKPSTAPIARYSDKQTAPHPNISAPRPLRKSPTKFSNKTPQARNQNSRGRLRALRNFSPRRIHLDPAQAESTKSYAHRTAHHASRRNDIPSVREPEPLTSNDAIRRAAPARAVNDLSPLLLLLLSLRSRTSATLNVESTPTRTTKSHCDVGTPRRPQADAWGAGSAQRDRRHSTPHASGHPIKRPDSELHEVRATQPQSGAPRGRVFQPVEDDVEVTTLERRDQVRPIVLVKFGTHAELACQGLGNVDLEADDHTRLVRALVHVRLAALQITAPADLPVRLHGRPIGAGEVRRGHERQEHGAKNGPGSHDGRDPTMLACGSCVLQLSPRSP